MSNKTSFQNLTGSEIFCEALLANGVEVIFGIPGGVLLPLYDVLPKYPELHHVLTRHEQAAGFAADAYARTRKKAGVALASSGPGATNLLTAIANAAADSVPVVFITGQVASALMGSDAFQETDILGMSCTTVKHSIFVNKAENIAAAIHEAFAIAESGRPGPIHVDITKDAFQQKARYSLNKKVIHRKSDYLDLKFEKKAQELKKLLALPSTKPIIIAGHGVALAGAVEELRVFSERHHIPVVNTLLGVGALALDHENSLSMLGMHGEAVANYAVAEANLIFGFGIRFDDRITGTLDTFTKGKKFVHIEIDPSEIHKNVSILLEFCGDLKTVLMKLNGELSTPHDFTKWWRQIRAYQQLHPLRTVSKKTHWKAQKGLSTPAIIAEISHATQGQAIISSDVGRHQMWIPRFYNFRSAEYSHLSSGGLGAMGYGLPAAVGASFAAPEREVWAICGDGSIQMNIQELATLLQEKRHIKIAVMNDHSLGIVRQWQQLLYQGNISQTDLTVLDFAAIARAYGHGGCTVEKASEIAAAIAEARAYDGTFLLNFLIDPDEHVYPMVPPMTALGEQLIG